MSPAKMALIEPVYMLLHSAAAYAMHEATRAENARLQVGMPSMPAAHLPQLQEKAAQARLNAMLLDTPGSAAELHHQPSTQWHNFCLIIAIVGQTQIITHKDMALQIIDGQVAVAKEPTCMW